MSDPGDTFTEVTSRSWISRIGQSIVGVLIGLVMVIASIVVLFWNEGRRSRQPARLRRAPGSSRMSIPHASIRRRRQARSHKWGSHRAWPVK